MKPSLFLQFLEIMTMSREREAEEDAAGGRPRSAAAGAHGAWGGGPPGAPATGAPAPGGPVPLPLDLMMLGYKRKKLVDGVMAGDGTREQLIARGEAAELRKCAAQPRVLMVRVIAAHVCDCFGVCLWDAQGVTRCRALGGAAGPPAQQRRFGRRRCRPWHL